MLQFQGLCFKVHRTRLAKQSEFLKHLLYDTHDGDVTNDAYTALGGEGTIVAWRSGTLDGSPVYYIDGVAPQDFDRLISVLDNAM